MLRDLLAALTGRKQPHPHQDHARPRPSDNRPRAQITYPRQRRDVLVMAAADAKPPVKRNP